MHRDLSDVYYPRAVIKGHKGAVVAIDLCAPDDVAAEVKVLRAPTRKSNRANVLTVHEYCYYTRTNCL